MKTNTQHTIVKTATAFALLATAAAALALPQQVNLMSLATKRAGACADCTAGGKSCDKSNSATGIAPGSACEHVGDIRANCNGEPGQIVSGSMGWARFLDQQELKISYGMRA
jgi:hypothetical protein